MDFDIIAAVDFTHAARLNVLRDGHIIRKMGNAVLFVAKGDPYPHWVSFKNVALQYGVINELVDGLGLRG